MDQIHLGGSRSGNGYWFRWVIHSMIRIIAIAIVPVRMVVGPFKVEMLDI